MRGGAGRRGCWPHAFFLAILLLPGSAFADAGRDRADRLCNRAETAERDARAAERKSAERQRFLKGAGGIGNAAPPVRSGNAVALSQPAREQIAQARALLPQIRKGIAAANQDRGIVPGLSEYFSRMEGILVSAVASIETCLDAPDRCNAPPMICPAPPNVPVSQYKGASADMVRQIQKTYRDAANQTYQACRNLQVEVTRAVDRLKQESRGAGGPSFPGYGADPQNIGDVDLYLRRAENLDREAVRHRAEADRESGIRGYCGVRGASRGPGANRVAFDALKAAAAREGKPEADFPLDAKVIDLKEAWEGKWGTGQALNTSNVSVPKLNTKGGDTGETVPGREKKENAALMESQKKRIDQRLEEPNKWSGGLYDSLKTNAPPLPYKKFEELQAGDVLLIAPEKENLKDRVTGWGINTTDKVLSGDTVSDASHTVIYLKEMNGRKMFMDNIPGEGVRIVPEEYLLQKYGTRETEVAKLAQPLNKEEAERLYAAAKELRSRNLEKMQGNNWFDTTNYGVWNKGNVVCAEADWALIKAAGRDVPPSDDRIKRALGIDFSPADFYGNEQYFLVSPLVMRK